VIAGLYVFERVFKLLSDEIKISFYFKDGETVKSGDIAAEVEGDIRAILSGERTALNFLQRMSGIATHTSKIVKMLEGSGIKLLDTRKTTPNNRIFEKYAVRVGGGQNHRFSLSDGIMLKDNHIAAAGGVRQAISLAREYAPFVHKIEVEAENLEMVREALEAKADIIMLDNMSVDDMKKAVKMIKGRALTECSGNVTAEKIAAIKEAGVDYISCGALTYNSSILDMSLKNLERIN
jgi:nicotinate-nucleotide pyrophosphorylase (carboxylating)